MRALTSPASLARSVASPYAGSGRMRQPKAGSVNSGVTSRCCTPVAVKALPVLKRLVDDYASSVGYEPKFHVQHALGVLWADGEGVWQAPL